MPFAVAGVEQRKRHDFTRKIAYNAFFKSLEIPLDVEKPSLRATIPRANRYFVPGYFWHITVNTAVGSNRSKRSTAALRSIR
jgi:hypothetical protein